MTTAEALGKAVIEKKQLAEELRNLRIKADRYGQQFLALGHLLKNDPAGIVFDDQLSRAGTSRGYFDSSECGITPVKELVQELRTKEERFNALTELLK